MALYIVLFPLIGALISGVFCRIISHRVSQALTSTLLCSAALISFIIFYKVIIKGNDEIIQLMPWLEVGNFSLNWSLKVDSLTAVMLVVVTSVSALVHVYSIGYMSHDPDVPRFMSYLSLFTFFMLMLVTSDNLIQLFLGWEGVGLCSYLLIGFWYKKPSANDAAMKAFVVNRVGDFGFILGIMAIYLLSGTVQFSQIFLNIAEMKAMTIDLGCCQWPALEVICILLFIGCMGKSAQIGLHTWLPDAMEGPTPVSALIHAATMVTAGVFLVARCSPLFEQTVIARELVTIIGAVTCLFAATIAITQNDIKKIIAYSTCSQLGYMFFACGVSVYNAAIFHLMTHAFFKALLFLGAGSVIHAMSGEQNIFKMGKIWRKIPITYGLMLIGSLALAGIPPFAGFYSKDMILEAAYAADSISGKFAFYCGLLAAFFTAFYSWRLLIKVFHGPKNYSDEVEHHIHESPLSMLIPLFILSIGAIGSGLVAEKILHIGSLESGFWRNAIMISDEHNILEKMHHVPSIVKFAPLIVGVAGILLAYLFYMFAPAIPEVLTKILSWPYKLSLNKYFIDELYDIVFVRNVKRISSSLSSIIDAKIIDGLGPNGSAWLAQRFALVVNHLQTGYLYHYALVMLLALVSVISWYIYLNI